MDMSTNETLAQDEMRRVTKMESQIVFDIYNDVPTYFIFKFYRLNIYG